jgi:hypothetical protein
VECEPLFDPEVDVAARASRRPGYPAFDEQEMVAWFAPPVLFASATEVGLSGLFGNFVDKREVQAGLPAIWWNGESTTGPHEDFWFDFASDTGDGYETMFPIAQLLSRDVAGDELDGGAGGEADLTLPQGELLVLGGDQVYPSATWSRYHDRFVGPFSRAFELSADVDRSTAARPVPRMFALPGNHDWYDGLTSFMRLFCQRGWIGGWKTMQTRSYFAIQLPRGWWLWGIDTQFDKYIDGPQLDYFQRAASLLQPGDRVILATAKPSWADVPKSGEVPEAWRTLAYFEQRVINEAAENLSPAGQVNPATLALTLTGDLHHYARYSEPGSAGDRQHKITAGGAGAFLSTTHWLEPELDLPRHTDLPPSGGRLPGVTYELNNPYPSLETSKRLRRGVLALPTHTHSFGVLIGVIYAIVALALAGALKDSDTGLFQSLRPDDQGRPFIALVGDATSVWVLAVAFLLLLLLFAYAAYGKVRGRKRLLVLPHWLSHIVLATAATIGGLAVIATLSPSQLDPGSIDIARQGFWAGWIVVGFTFGVGFTLGRVVFALYLWVASLGNDRAHATEVFASQSRASARGYKQFLRIRIRSDGALTIYAIGVLDPVAAPNDLQLIDRIDIDPPIRSEPVEIR